MTLLASLFNSDTESPKVPERRSVDSGLKLQPVLLKSDCNSPNIVLTDDKKKNFEAIRSNIRCTFAVHSLFVSFPFSSILGNYQRFKPNQQIC